MKLKLNKITLAEQIANALRANIQSNQFANGMLPKEEDLAKDLKVSRGTIRAAMALLEQEDLIIRIKKRGTFVKEIHSAYQGFIPFENLNLFFYGSHEDFNIQNKPGFFGYVYNAILAEANRKNFKIKLVTIENKDALQECLKIKSTGNLIFGIGNKSIIKAITQLDTPAILIDHEQKGIDSVNVDSYQGSAEAVKYLHDKGHRKFLFMDYKHNYLNSDRSQGVMETLKELKVPEKNIVRIFSDSEKASAAKQMTKLITEKNLKQVTAIICYNSEMAFGILKSLKEHDYLVPRDFSIVSCGNISDIEKPFLSTVDFDLNYLGCLAIDHIYSKINGTQPQLTNNLVRGFVVDRGSIRNLLT